MGEIKTRYLGNLLSSRRVGDAELPHGILEVPFFLNVCMCVCVRVKMISFFLFSVLYTVI